MADKLPLLANVRWFQLAFGAFAGIVLHRLWLHGTGALPLRQGPLTGLVLALALALLVFVVYLQNVYRFGIVPDYSLKCRFCNGPVNRYSEFCEHCGADLIAPEKLVPCPKCEAEVFEGTKFCPECGVNLARPAKGKKGKRKAAPEPPEGWDTPVDALSGFPPVDEKR